MTTQETPQRALDPVCGMTVEPATARGGAVEHAGKTYYFCLPGCREKFAKDPEHWLQKAGQRSKSADGAHAHAAPSTRHGAPSTPHEAPGTEHEAPSTKHDPSTSQHPRSRKTRDRCRLTVSAVPSRIFTSNREPSIGTIDAT